MLRYLLTRCRNFQKFFLRHLVANYCCNRWFSFCDGSGLVKHYCINFLGLLQCLSTLYENAVIGSKVNEVLFSADAGAAAAVG